MNPAYTFTACEKTLVGVLRSNPARSLQARREGWQKCVSWTQRPLHDTLGSVSYRAKRKRAITVRVVEARLKQVMRARRIATQSELFNTLLDEEVEKITARKALELSAGKLGAKDFDDRLL